MKTITFSSNWNNKLDNNCFTTFRIWYPNRFKPREKIEINLVQKNKIIKTFEGNILLSIPVLLKNVPEILCYLDTGYSKEEFINLVRTMYKNQNVDCDTQMFVFYLIKHI